MRTEEKYLMEGDIVGLTSFKEKKVLNIGRNVRKNELKKRLNFLMKKLSLIERNIISDDYLEELDDDLEEANKQMKEIIIASEGF